MNIGERIYTILVITMACLFAVNLAYSAGPMLYAVTEMSSWTGESDGDPADSMVDIIYLMRAAIAFFYIATIILFLTTIYNVWKSKLAPVPTIIQGIILFFAFPFGTAISLYGFYLLNDAEKKSKQSPEEPSEQKMAA